MASKNHPVEHSEGRAEEYVQVADPDRSVSQVSKMPRFEEFEKPKAIGSNQQREIQTSKIRMRSNFQIQGT